MRAVFFSERLFNKKMTHRLRSDTVTRGKLMAGARSLLRANGMKEKHFGRPVIAVVNSYTDMVPGHRALNIAASIVKEEILEMGFFAPEFNTIAIDDGIAMGHGGMLYSLPSRDLIADSVEYMCNAHCVDAMICISNCDKITPGMLMAAMRLNIPAIFVSGGPMEAGRSEDQKYDLVDVMVAAGDDSTSDEDLLRMERTACPGCGSCAGLFTANSMNSLAEALGLALPGNGSVVATHKNRTVLLKNAARQIVTNATDYYENGRDSVLPRSIATKSSFTNALKVDIAMGGSTNTILHMLAIANEAGVDLNMSEIDELSRSVPNLCKVSPSADYYMEDINRAGGIVALMAELDRAGFLQHAVHRVDRISLKELFSEYDIMSPKADKDSISIYYSAPAGKSPQNFEFISHDTMYPELDKDRVTGCVRDYRNAYSKEGGLAVLFGNLAVDGCIVKTAGVDDKSLFFHGPAKVFESQDDACRAILSKEVAEGDVVIIRYEGPKGGPGMQEMLYPTSYIKAMGLGNKCALITDGRFSGGTSGLSIGHVSPEAAAGGNIAVIKSGDMIRIDIVKRRIEIEISDQALLERHTAEKKKGDKAYTPEDRNRDISNSLKLYARNVSSADKGAIRIIS